MECEGVGSERERERMGENERGISGRDGEGRTHVHSDARERRRSDVERSERNGRDGRREKEMRWDENGG